MLRYKTKKKENKQKKKENNQNKNVKKTLQKAEILKQLRNTPGFLGCYKQSDLCISIQKHSCLMVYSGQHWIAITIFDKLVEIFDPGGFKILKWKSFPCSLLHFLQKILVTRELVISKKVSERSTLSSFYCLIYLMNRPRHTLYDITSYCLKMK